MKKSSRKQRIEDVHEQYGYCAVNPLFTLSEQMEFRWTKRQVYNVFHNCAICNAGVKLSHGKGHDTMVRKPGEVLCVDLFGSREDMYALLLTDKATGLMYGNIIDSRSEASTARIAGLKFLINFFPMFGKHPLILRSDNEFDTAEIHDFLISHGMKSELIAPHSSFQDVTAERANGLI